MYHLLIERVSTVTIEFLQYRARVRIELNRAGIERAVERTNLFTSLHERSDRQPLCEETPSATLICFILFLFFF
jgi:hypothetical protein